MSLALPYPRLLLLAVALAAVAPERGGLGIGPALLALSLPVGVKSMLCVVYPSYFFRRFLILTLIN